METGKDHIHLLINYPPNVTVTSIAYVENEYNKDNTFF